MRGVLRDRGRDALFPFPSWPVSKSGSTRQGLPAPAPFVGSIRGGSGWKSRRLRPRLEGSAHETGSGGDVRPPFCNCPSDGQRPGHSDSVPSPSVTLCAQCHRSQCITNPRLPPFIPAAASDLTFFYSVGILAQGLRAGQWLPPAPPEGSSKAGFHAAITACEPTLLYETLHFPIAKIPNDVGGLALSLKKVFARWFSLTCVFKTSLGQNCLIGSSQGRRVEFGLPGVIRQCPERFLTFTAGGGRATGF